MKAMSATATMAMITQPTALFFVLLELTVS